MLLKRHPVKLFPYEIVSLRAGDLAEFYACPKKAKELLSWEAKHALEDMLASSWKWQSQNPQGYYES